MCDALSVVFLEALVVLQVRTYLVKPILTKHKQHYMCIQWEKRTEMLLKIAAYTHQV